MFIEDDFFIKKHHLFPLKVLSKSIDLIHDFLD